ncbi:MAG: UrcA family protein [Pseudomonadota bacterium]
MTKTLFAAATAAMISLASASAQDVTVRFDTQALETRAGTERVYETLTRRVRSACNDGTVASRMSHAAVSACETDMMDQLVSSINRPELFAFHNTETQYAGQ